METMQELVNRIDPRYRPVWEGRPPHEQLALSLYFLPHRSRLAIVSPTRPRLVKWYCPFACQSVFPSGHRYCLNVYTGCAHRCLYCYAAAYGPDRPRSKHDFPRLLQKDLADLDRFNVPSAPIHLSNSTDPFQPLEEELGHTKRALEGILAHRHRFTTVVLLTKNPALAARTDYLALLRELGSRRPLGPGAGGPAGDGQPRVQVEVSLAFWREEARAFWDPAAPSVVKRLEGIRALAEAGIPIVLRIDPLFPRSPLSSSPRLTLANFGLAEAQTLDDLGHLVALAKEVRARHVVYSAIKIVRSGRAGFSQPMKNLKDAAAVLVAPEKPIWRGGSWRLPRLTSEKFVTGPFLELCRSAAVPAKFCMQNLIDTP